MNLLYEASLILYEVSLFGILYCRLIVLLKSDSRFDRFEILAVFVSTTLTQLGAFFILKERLVEIGWNCVFDLFTFVFEIVELKPCSLIIDNTISGNSCLE